MSMRKLGKYTLKKKGTKTVPLGIWRLAKRALFGALGASSGIKTVSKKVPPYRENIETDKK